MITPAPTVSIVLSVYNGAKTLPRALASIRQQTYSDYELIVIDDASTDSTAIILQEWRNNFPHQGYTIIANDRNLGLTRSLNRGIAAARGTWIARLDADDRWLPEKLARQVQLAKQEPGVGLIGCWYYNEYQGRRQPVRLPVTDAAIKRGMFKRNPFGHSCILVKRSLLQAVGGYDESLRYAQDRDVWFRLYEQTKMANVPEFLCVRDTNQGISRRHTRAQMLTSARLLLKYQRRLRAPWWSRLFIIEPLLVACTPAWLKRLWH